MSPVLNVKYSAAIKGDIYTKLGKAGSFRRLAELGVRDAVRIREAYPLGNIRDRHCLGDLSLLDCGIWLINLHESDVSV